MANVAWDDEEPTVQWDTTNLSSLTTKINQINQELNLPDWTALRQLKQESGLNLKAYNKGSKAAGIAQVIPQTQQSLEKRFGRKLDPYNEDDALLMYKEVMGENLRKFGNVTDALRAYNSGWEPAKWSNTETVDYVQKILPTPKVAWDKPPEKESKETEFLKQTASSGAKLIDMVGAFGFIAFANSVCNSISPAHLGHTMWPSFHTLSNPEVRPPTQSPATIRSLETQ